MSAVAFDTLKLARKLRDTAHMSQEQAEGIADALAEAMSGAELATKNDIRELATATKNDLAEVQAASKADLMETKAELKADLMGVKAELKADVAAVRADLMEVEHHLDSKISAVRADVNHLKWMGGVIVAFQVAMFVKLFIH